jgi:polyribonucleotide 5'-hydroxyl-kinase
MTNAAVTVETYATTGIPPNTVHPLVTFHGSSSQIHPTLYKAQVDHLATSIHKRLQQDDYANASGIIVNTNGWIRDEGYELLLHTVTALDISVILVIGHDRLYSLLTTHYKKDGHDNPTILTPKIVKFYLCSKKSFFPVNTGFWGRVTIASTSASFRTF